MFTKSNIPLAILLASSCNVAQSEDRFSLPSSKSFIEQCEHEALTLHPGEVIDQQMFHPTGNIEIRFEITDKNSIEWVVFCDGTSGKIIRHYKLSDETH